MPSGTRSEAKSLLGQRLAFAGRLLLLPRQQVQARIEALGGSWTPRVDAQTTLLVVGDSGWPLTRRGRMAPNLRRALRLRRQGATLDIREESDFWRLLAGVDAPAMTRLYTLVELPRLLSLPRQTIEHWIKRGGICPAQTQAGIPLFDFHGVASLRHLARLLARGVSASRLARSLRQLRRWRPQAERGLAQLSLLAGGTRIVARLSDGRLVEPSGQLLLPLEEPTASGVVPYEARRSLDDQIDEALELEESGRLAQAAVLYERLLHHHGGDAQLWLNYGNVLFALDRAADAAAAFENATECDGQFVAAWNNLGAARLELGDFGAAEEALRKALWIDPENADAQHNLADLLTATGHSHVQ